MPKDFEQMKISIAKAKENGADDENAAMEAFLENTT
jgi:hypothetical protein